MSKEHITYRKSNGVLCPCQDIGADDFDRARTNRLIVENKMYTIGYLEVENWFAHSPLHSLLPDWMPSGRLPHVGKRDWQQSGGERGGEFVVFVPEVVGT